MTFQLIEGGGGGLRLCSNLEGSQRLGGNLRGALGRLRLSLGLKGRGEQVLSEAWCLSRAVGAPSNLTELLIDDVQCLDQFLKSGRIIRVEQHSQAIEEADTLRVDA